VFPVHEAWFRDDPKSGLEELGRIIQSFDSLDPVRREVLAINVGLCYLGFGKVKAAGAWFEKITDEVLTHELLALAAYAAGDDKLCWEHAAKFGHHPGSARKAEYSTGVALARAGVVQESQRFIENYQKFLENIFVIHLKGEVALAEGRIEEAIHLLQQATDDFRHGGNHEFLISSDGLALAFERHGEPQEALRVLEDASPARRLEFAWESPFGMFWLRIQAHLAQLYRHTGRTEEARKIEGQLRKILAYADPDHPILLQLRRSS
jgi:tetratricopeptide (TPR) repeat protein